MNGIKEFPSPREVDRFLYKKVFTYEYWQNQFPSPLEVDRFLYTTDIYRNLDGDALFPSPREVDR